ncbi:MAG: recombination mediator RecR [Oscillospiraceae bacterium]|jgi:recombination protein RecR|nr:recombination mediator RecR [Oscillospiraceae bacterium]
MAQTIDPIARMTAQLSRLPGIGRKSAQRLAYYLAAQPEETVLELADALVRGRQALTVCPRCGNYTTDDLCPLCADPRRDPRTLCVVRDPRDVAAIERMREYKGGYHVLHGTISPMDGIGPSDIRIRELMARLGSETIEEVILATNPDIEGEATASYIARMVKPLGVRVTRLAHGMPVGGDLEYVDEVTLNRAFEGRREM